MKMSNFALAIVAIAVGTGVFATHLLTPTVKATSVISVPAKAGMSGSGYTIALPGKLTEHQATVLAIAYATAKSDGSEYPQLLQGIILQESKAGNMASYKVAGQEFGLGPNKRYYGVGQLKLSAAQDVLRHFPDMWDKFNFQTKTDEEIIAKLIDNDSFNIAIASKYLILLRRAGYDDPRAIAMAYNKGVGGARDSDPLQNEYSISVSKHIEKLKLGKKGTQAALKRAEVDHRLAAD